MQHQLEIVRLDENTYKKLYEESFRAPAYTHSFTEELHRAEFDCLETELRSALSQHWEEDACGNKDFAIGEWFGGWHHCGGIYSSLICCPEYVKIIVDVLALLPHAGLWTYHTACEVWHEDSPFPAFGEFFIRGGKLYAPNDENDYARVFGNAA